MDNDARVEAVMDLWWRDRLGYLHREFLKAYGVDPPPPGVRHGSED